MKKIILTLMALTSLIIVSYTAKAVALTIISLPYTITAPGYYTLAQGYVNRATSTTPVVISINASNVVLDLGDNNVLLNAAIAQTNSTGGIVATGSNVTVKNGAITFTGTAANFCEVRFNNCVNSIVENIQFSATGAALSMPAQAGITGVFDLGGTGDVIQNCQFDYVTAPLNFQTSVGGNVAENNVSNHTLGSYLSSGNGNVIKNNVLIRLSGFNTCSLRLGSADQYEGNNFVGYPSGSVIGGINGGNNVGQ